MCHAVSRSQYVSRGDGHAREVRGLLSSHQTGAGAGAVRASADQSEASIGRVDQSETGAGSHLTSLAWSREELRGNGRQHLPGPPRITETEKIKHLPIKIKNFPTFRSGFCCP